MKIESKILNGLERISDVFKSLLWQKAKKYGISPIQIQILLFVANHREDICNVSYLAKEFQVTKATISDAIRVLVNKKLLEKDFSPMDRRRYNLMTTSEGSELIHDLSQYALPLHNTLNNFSQKELAGLFDTITKLIYQLNQTGIIQVQRTCFNCKYYKGDRGNKHFCNLLDKKLRIQDIRLDCQEFEEMAVGNAG